jgi:hypothetical protein
VGQDQDPYGDAGGFTPYQPDPTPDGEPADAGTPPPFVPYGGTPNVPNVPYGGAPNVPYGGSSIGTPFVVNASRGRWVGWVVGIAILLFTCGGSGIAIVASLINGDDSTTSGPSPDVVVPEIEIPSFEVPSIEVPSIEIPPLVFANNLQRDQCLLGVGFEPGSTQGISSLEVSGCTGAHNAQVLEVRVLNAREAAEYDFADDEQGNKSCFPLFSPAQKALFQGDKYTLLSFTETATPTQGDKVACLIVRTDGALYRGFLPKSSR